MRVALYFSEPRRGKEKYEQWAKCPLVLYAKPSNKRFIIPLQKNCYFAVGFYFLGKSIQKHPDSVCENDVNNEQTVRAYYEPLNERLIILYKKTLLLWLLFSILFSSVGSSSSAIVGPFATAGIRPVVNRLNQDTTVYYGLIFCAFSWPYMVKWHNSGIIITNYTLLSLLFSGFLKHDQATAIANIFVINLKYQGQIKDFWMLGQCPKACRFKKDNGWLASKVGIASHDFHLFVQILYFWLGCSLEGWLATQPTPPGSKHLHNTANYCWQVKKIKLESTSKRIVLLNNLVTQKILRGL